MRVEYYAVVVRSCRGIWSGAASHSVYMQSSLHAVTCLRSGEGTFLANCLSGEDGWLAQKRMESRSWDSDDAVTGRARHAVGQGMARMGGTRETWLGMRTGIRGRKRAAGMRPNAQAFGTRGSRSRVGERLSGESDGEYNCCSWLNEYPRSWRIFSAVKNSLERGMTPMIKSIRRDWRYFGCWLTLEHTRMVTIN